MPEVRRPAQLGNFIETCLQGFHADDPLAQQSLIGSMAWIAGIGIAAFALAWIPQSIETVKAGRCDVNVGFLALACLGSFSLTLYAWLRSDAVFASLNALTTCGAVVNIYFKLNPRRG